MKMTEKMASRFFWFVAFVSVLVIVFGPAVASAGQAPSPHTVTSPQITDGGEPRTARLTWTAPAVYTDNTPINEALTYNVYEGLCSSVELTKVLEGLTVLTVTRTNQAPGELCYQITAVTPNGGESTRTVRGSKSFPWPRPNTAQTLTVE